uniref:Uncharacterized protein n=1 Tax=viral metagenome TaxID=1070528 RepID=A0A6C0JY94_9ZZZZ
MNICKTSDVTRGRDVGSQYWYNEPSTSLRSALETVLEPYSYFSDLHIKFRLPSKPETITFKDGKEELETFFNWKPDSLYIGFTRLHRRYFKEVFRCRGEFDLGLITADIVHVDTDTSSKLLGLCYVPSLLCLVVKDKVSRIPAIRCANLERLELREIGNLCMCNLSSTVCKHLRSLCIVDSNFVAFGDVKLLTSLEYLEFHGETVEGWYSLFKHLILSELYISVQTPMMGLTLPINCRTLISPTPYTIPSVYDRNSIAVLKLTIKHGLVLPLADLLGSSTTLHIIYTGSLDQFMFEYCDVVYEGIEELGIIVVGEYEVPSYRLLSKSFPNLKTLRVELPGIRLSELPELERLEVTGTRDLRPIVVDVDLEELTISTIDRVVDFQRVPRCINVHVQSASNRRDRSIFRIFSRPEESQ